MRVKGRAILLYEYFFEKTLNGACITFFVGNTVINYFPVPSFSLFVVCLRNIESNANFIDGSHYLQAIFIFLARLPFA